MFRRILVANRGEIASRILRACREMEIKTVAVHSTADASSPHLKLADESLCIGGARAGESYLNMDAILQAAEQTGCQAIHPGYGFLAENALFAARCASHRITFIGPPSAAIRRMGDKVEARRTMEEAGVPVIPGSRDPLQSTEEAIREADKAGYPVMIKAVAGGGGRGMRRCDDANALRRSFPEAAAEAEAAFGNPSLYMEKYIEHGRHIEFQILADRYGDAVHLGERECSVQRNHQKLIEEAPSPVLTPEERNRFGHLAAGAAARIGYTGAGTLEFLRDQGGSLHFMEMNTRLQVEHPITEEISGVDIVQAQIRIAAGERLKISQEEIRLAGHAVECRINAEDPSAAFRPAPGTLDKFDVGGTASSHGNAPNPEEEIPKQSELGPRLRVETHVEDGYVIPPHYDSLIAKVITWGTDRHEALNAMAAALTRAKIEGVPTTAPFHLQVLADEDFRAGRYDVSIAERILASPPARKG
jgi:acetyl-CoA carboxylase biotin carboxylase subunit